MRRISARTGGLGIVLTGMAFLVGVVCVSVALVAGSDKPKDANAGGAATTGGIMTTDQNKDSLFLMMLTDGEDAPVKYVFADGFDKKSLQGIFSVSRAQVKYVKDGDTRKLLSIKKEPPAAKGTVTGAVVFTVKDGFWVAVKPRNGPPDGYADNWPPGEMSKKLKTLNKGDTVTIKFHTDGERHRIESLDVVSRATGPTTTQAASRPAGARGPARC